MSLSTRQLAQLCRRLGVGLQAGLDIRTAWEREAQRAPAGASAAMLHVLRCVNAGDALADALREDGPAGRLIPPLVREMISVGEQTGKLDQVFQGLAEHYEHLLELRRTLLLGLIWPALQLAAAVIIIGLLILMLGLVAELTQSEASDVLGLGLVGVSGLAVYVLVLAALGGLAVLGATALRRGWLGTAPLRIAMRLPLLGRCLRSLALSRFAWSLSLALHAGMDVRPAMRLALRGANNPMFSAAQEQVDEVLAQRREMAEALAPTGVFPPDFLAAVETGELTGQTPELLDRQALEHQNHARTAMRFLSVAAGFACWGLVSLAIVVLIVRIALWYANLLNDLAQPNAF